MMLLKRLNLMSCLKMFILLTLLILVKKTDYDSMINEIKAEIPSVTGLGTTAALLILKIRYPMLLILSKNRL